MESNVINRIWITTFNLIIRIRYESDNSIINGSGYGSRCIRSDNDPIQLNITYYLIFILFILLYNGSLSCLCNKNTLIFYFLIIQHETLN